MCPSYMATKEEKDVTRGRANVLRLAMTGRLKEAGLDDHGVYESLDLCLECRACKAECPVGVDMARFKSEFLAGYWQTYGTPIEAQVLGNVGRLARLGSPFASIVNRVSGSTPVRHLLGIDQRRSLPQLSSRSLASRVRGRGSAGASVLLFADTFTNYYDPEIGVAAWEVLEAGRLKVALAPNQCCGRPMISKGLLRDAAEQARRNTVLLYEAASGGQRLVFCEPSCLSAMREDAACCCGGGAAAGSGCCGCLRFFRGGSSRASTRLEERPSQGSAAWSLPSEIYGSGAFGFGTAWQDSWLRCYGSRCRLLRDGWVVWIFERSLRCVSRYWRTQALPSGAREGFIHGDCGCWYFLPSSDS